MAINFANGGSQQRPARILQVTQNVIKGTFVTTSQTEVDTNISHSITPYYSTSRILVIVNATGAAHNSLGGDLRLYRGSTNIVQADTNGSNSRASMGSLWTGDGAGDGGMLFTTSLTYVDSPSTTSSTTYKLRCRSYSGGVVRINNHEDANTSNADMLVGCSYITLIELAS